MGGVKLVRSGSIVETVRSKLKKMEVEADVAIAQEILEMKQRIQGGIDVHGAPFDPYSPGYAKFRAKHGKQIDHVDLRFQGLMQSSITYKVERTAEAVTWTVFFEDAIEKQKARWNSARRKFFGFTREQTDRIRRRIKSVL